MQTTHDEARCDERLGAAETEPGLMPRPSARTSNPNRRRTVSQARIGRVGRPGCVAAGVVGVGVGVSLVAMAMRVRMVRMLMRPRNMRLLLRVSCQPSLRVILRRPECKA